MQTVSQPAGNTVVPLTGYSNMYIGYSNTNSGYFDGRIDDVKVFDRPLLAEEIGQEYQNGDLMAHWALDEKQSATTAYDDTLRGNNGTNSGATIDQPGQVNTAYDFNGSTSYVSVPCMNYSQLTISAWLYWDPAHGSNAESICGGLVLEPQRAGSAGLRPAVRFKQQSIEFDLITQNSNGVKS